MSPGQWRVLVLLLVLLGLEALRNQALGGFFTDIIKSLKGSAS